MVLVCPVHVRHDDEIYSEEGIFLASCVDAATADLLCRLINAGAEAEATAKSSGVNG